MKLKLFNVAVVFFGSIGASYQFREGQSWLILPFIAPILYLLIVETRLSNLRLPKPKVRELKMSVEWVDDLDRPRIMAELPDSMTLEAIRYMNIRLQQGYPFTRRGMCKAGVCTQSQYRAMAEFFLKMNLVKKQHGGKSSGYVLRQSARSMIEEVGSIEHKNKRLWENEL